MGATKGATRKNSPRSIGNAINILRLHPYLKYLIIYTRMNIVHIYTYTHIFFIYYNCSEKRVIGCNHATGNSN